MEYGEMKWNGRIAQRYPYCGVRCGLNLVVLESKESLWFESGELPPSPKLQFTRAAHKANDCVNCGQCEDACRVEIPLSTFFQQSSKEFGEQFARFDELTSI
jgi:ferredoxin